MKKIVSILFFLSLFVGLTSCSDTTEDTDTQTPVSTIGVDYIGLSVSDAQAKAQEEEEVFRIVEQDGEPLPATMDYRPGRINASVENDIVVSYQVEGEETEIKDDERENTPETSEYIGRTTIEAVEYAKEKGVAFRVVMEDGDPLPATRDFQPGRISASVQKGIVVSYEIEESGYDDVGNSQISYKTEPNWLEFSTSYDVGNRIDELYFQYPSDMSIILEKDPSNHLYDLLDSFIISDGNSSESNIFYVTILENDLSKAWENDKRVFLTNDKELMDNKKKIGDYEYEIYTSLTAGRGYGYIHRSDRFIYIFESSVGPKNELFDRMLETVHFPRHLRLGESGTKFSLDIETPYFDHGPNFVSFSDTANEEYSVSLSKYTSSNELLESVINSPVNGMKSSITNIGNYSTISYTDGGACEHRTMEIVGTGEYNLSLTTNGCIHSREDDFAFFSKIAATISEL